MYKQLNLIEELSWQTPYKHVFIGKDPTLLAFLTLTLILTEIKY